MTKYVLNSGGMSSNPDGARRFFAELVKDLGNNPKILICAFAQPRGVWESSFEPYNERYRGYMPAGVTPEFTLAMPDDFANQVAQSDAIYCHGGDDHLALYWFTTLNVASVWEGKPVGTCSATTHILSKHFWTCDWRRTMDGMGVLPIRTLAHYNSAYGETDPRGPIDWEQAKRELESYGDTTLPLYALPEGEFIVIEQ